MDRRTMARKLAEICYYPKRDTDDEKFAVQLFFEALVIPKNATSWSLEEMTSLIEDFMVRQGLGTEPAHG